MEDFPFTFNLTYKEESEIVKPPDNCFKLKEIASKKFDTEIEEMVYITNNGEEMILKNEQDYADLIDYASSHNLNELEIIINREKENEEEEEENEEDNKETKENLAEKLGINCEPDEYGDNRNRKANTEEEYKKHNKGFKETKRIGYIVEKKQMQRDEDLKNNKEKKKKKK